MLKSDDKLVTSPNKIMDHLREKVHILQTQFSVLFCGDLLNLLTTHTVHVLHPIQK